MPAIDRDASTGTADLANPANEEMIRWIRGFSVPHPGEQMAVTSSCRIDQSSFGLWISNP